MYIPIEFLTRQEDPFHTHTHLPLTLEKPSVFSISYTRKEGGVWWSKDTKNRVWEKPACPPLGHHTTPVFWEPLRTRCETWHRQRGDRMGFKTNNRLKSKKLEVWTTGSHRFLRLMSNEQSSTFLPILDWNQWAFPDVTILFFFPSLFLKWWKKDSFPLHQYYLNSHIKLKNLWTEVESVICPCESKKPDQFRFNYQTKLDQPYEIQLQPAVFSVRFS